MRSVAKWSTALGCLEQDDDDYDNDGHNDDDGDDDNAD